jgi:CRISPR-associated protein Csb2
MPTLMLRFPGGRYHATPWGHHVNEGLLEWPPSPWRLARALLACGYATQGWKTVPPSARRLVEALCGQLPRYRLPRAAAAHSRHFMPLGVLEHGREKTTLVFDAWADVGDEPMFVSWDCALDTDASALISSLARSLSYLGRSESWVVASVVPDSDAAGIEYNAVPHVEGSRPGPGWEQISLMVPEAPAAYAAWRTEAVARALAAFPLPGGDAKPPKKPVQSRQAAELPYPADLLDCLQRDTAWWKSHQWSQPPGARRALYWRRSDCLEVSPAERHREPHTSRVPMMLLALTAPSGRSTALPSTSRALPQAELLHRALVARLTAEQVRDCVELVGRDRSGIPARGHRHAYILPVDLDLDGRLDHILVCAEMGLGGAAQRAMRSLERTWTKGGVGELRLAVAACGDWAALRRLPSPLDEGCAQLLGPEEGARVWRSVRPFVPPRHLKPRGRNSAQGQVNAELASRGLPPASVIVLPWDDATRAMRHAARVRRAPASAPPVDLGFALELTFDQPVRGPIALGYASHFGLGIFGAVS